MRLLKCKKVNLDKEIVDKYYCVNKIYTNDSLTKIRYTLDIAKILDTYSIFDIEQPVNIEELLPNELKVELSVNGEFIGYNLFSHNTELYLNTGSIIKFDYFIPAITGYQEIVFTNSNDFISYMGPKAQNSIIIFQYNKGEQPINDFTALTNAVNQYFIENPNWILYGE